MRVLKNPRAEAEAWRLEVVCSRCESTLEVAAADVRISLAQPERNDAWDAHHVGVCDCPVCGVVLNIARERIPDGVWSRLERSPLLNLLTGGPP